MNELQILIGQMAADVSREIARLDEIHLQKFLAWLQAHSCKLKKLNQLQKGYCVDSEEQTEDHLRNGLREWFASLPIAGLLWEYRLLLNEIAWSQELDPPSLVHIIRSEDGIICSNS